MSSSTALVLIDLINEIVSPNGKLAGKGYADFQERYKSLDIAKSLLAKARQKNCTVIHVRLGFSMDYKELAEHSPLFGGAKSANAFQIGTWGTEFDARIAPLPHETVLVKHRVSAFYQTSLELLLRTQRINNVVVAGCATDLAVQSSVRDAHDRDFSCVVAADSCIAANDDDHMQTLRCLNKIAVIKKSEELFVYP